MVGREEKKDDGSVREGWRDGGSDRGREAAAVHFSFFFFSLFFFKWMRLFHLPVNHRRQRASAVSPSRWGGGKDGGKGGGRRATPILIPYNGAAR